MYKKIYEGKAEGKTASVSFSQGDSEKWAKIDYSIDSLGLALTLQAMWKPAGTERYLERIVLESTMLDALTAFILFRILSGLSTVETDEDVAELAGMLLTTELRRIE